jgi:hypothetical protein
MDILPLILTFSRREKEPPLAGCLTFVSFQAICHFRSAGEPGA